jgi:hypothetical protein
MNGAIESGTTEPECGNRRQSGLLTIQTRDLKEFMWLS